MAGITKKQFIAGSFWKIVEQFSTKAISLTFSVILTRLLSPNDYGLIALTVVFTNLSDILIDGGFSTALIRKKTVDDCDFSCVLFVSISISTFLYIIIFAGAPTISNYYGEPQLTSVLRVIGLILFIQAFSSVRTAVVNRNMQFKLLFRCNFFGTLLSGFLGVIAALWGMGVWALVVQRLMQLALSTIFLLISVRWKIKFKFSFTRLKEIFRFSSGVVASSLINYLSSSLYSLVIGKKYSVKDLGYCDKGAQLPTQVSLYTFGAMSNVLLPTLSSYQSEKEKMKQIVRKVTQMTSFLIAPMMVGLALVSREVVVLLFTETWLPIVPIMQANCIYYFATPFMLINVQVFFALGHSSARVKTELIRCFLQVASILFFGLFIGCSINQLAYVSAAVAVISAIVTFVEAKPMIAYTTQEFLSDIYLSLLCAVIMGTVIYIVEKVIIKLFYELPNFTFLVVKIFVGVVAYIIFSVIFKSPGLKEIKTVLLTLKSKKGK